MEILLNGDCAFLTDKVSGARVVVQCVDGVFAIHPVINNHIGNNPPGVPNRMTVSAPPKNVVVFTATQMAFLFTAEEHLVHADHTAWVRPDWQNITIDSLASTSVFGEHDDFHRKEIDKFYSALAARFGVTFDRQYLAELKTLGAVYHYMMTLNPDLKLEVNA